VGRERPPGIDVKRAAKRHRDRSDAGAPEREKMGGVAFASACRGDRFSHSAATSLALPRGGSERGKIHALSSCEGRLPDEALAETIGAAV
jgi:hypothetical protein